MTGGGDGEGGGGRKCICQVRVTFESNSNYKVVIPYMIRLWVGGGREGVGAWGVGVPPSRPPAGLDFVFC